MRSLARFALGLSTLLFTGGAGAVEYVNDPLTSASFAGRGSQGGSFGPAGWTTSGATDAIWYEIADALPSGSIEFSVTGVSTTGSLTGADHDIFAMYQAPTGAPEPVAYSPYFRNNDFKVFTRIFGVEEPNRAGAMKMEFSLCPRGEPWYHDEACTPECGKNDLAYANGMDKDIGWDAGTWYKIGITWGNGSVSFARDGATLGSIAYTGTYAPAPLRVRLGSPRHGISNLAFMPSGLTFKDVLVTGEPGSMTPVCQPVMPDAGAGGTGGAGGSTGSQTASGEYMVLQDVTGASWSPQVFEDVTDLNVEGTNGEPAAVVYLRFPGIAGMVKKATLRLHTHAYPSASGGSGVVYAVTDTSWNELSLTWGNRPPTVGAPHGDPQAVSPDSDVEWDVTDLVAAGTVDFAVLSTDSDGAHYMSKEAGDAAHAPRLLVDVVPEMPDGGTTGGAGGTTATTGSGASSGSAGNAGNAGSGAGSTSGSGGGDCSCDLASPAGSFGAPLALLAALAAWARRRSRRTGASRLG